MIHVTGRILIKSPLIIGVSAVLLLVLMTGMTMLSINTVSATASIVKVQSGLVASDPLTTGNLTDWTLGGTATSYKYYEDSQGLHIGVQSPQSGQDVNYHASSAGTNAQLFHTTLTIPYASVADGVFNPGLYVGGSNYAGIVGCQAYADKTGYYWIVQSSTDDGSTWTTLYAPPVDTLPQTDDCTVISNGSNYLKVYIGGNAVFSSTTMNLDMQTPLHASIQTDTSSSSMDYATFLNYYATTNENIEVTNNPSTATTVQIVGTAGNVLATAPISAGTATLNVGQYNFPLSATINVYDSNNSTIASSPATIYGGDVFSVNSGTSTAPQPPTGLTATSVTSSQINLSWIAPSSNGGSAITGYMIARSANSGSTWSTIVSNTGSTSTTYSDTGLTASTPYTYRVSAINSVGTSTPSSTASATTSSGITTSSIVLNTIQSTSGTVSSSPYQLTLSNFNAGTSSNNLLVIGVQANNAAVTSVTFGGIQLTKKITSFHNNDVEFWYLKNPTGTGNIVVTMAGSTSAVVGAYSFSGVDQTTPIPTSATNHNTAASSPTISITTQYPNSLVLDLPAIYGGVTLGSSTCIQQWDVNIPSAVTGASSSTLAQSAGSVTCKWTASGGGDMWDDAAIEIKASDTGTTTAPGAPTGLTATSVTSSQINLSWTAPSNNGGSVITGYMIEQSTNGGSTWSTVVSNTGSAATTYSNTGLAASTTYTYRVSAINSVGTSTPSNTASATTGTTSTAPGSPTGLTATASSSSQINLSWTAPSSNGGSAITGYKIERSTNSGSTWSTVQSNTASTSTTYSDTGLAASTTYTYRVSAINSVGTSTPSSTASATTSSGGTTSSIVLNNVQSTSGAVSSSPYAITLSNFNAGTGSNNLLVVGVSANNNYVTSVTFGGIQLTKAISSFHNNDAEFWYLTKPSGTGNIIVTMAGSTSAVVGAYSFSGVDQTTPIPTSATNHNSANSSPTISITTQYHNSLVLDLPAIYGGVTLGFPSCTKQWDVNIPSAVTGASSSTVVSSPNQITCSWTASSDDMWDDAAIEVKASATASSTAPQPPTNLSANAASSSQINLNWVTPSDNGGSQITGYMIERSSNSGSTWSTIQSNTASTSTAYSDTGLAASTAYTYRVSAINSVGTSSPSSTASATTNQQYSITLAKAGLVISDSLTNETQTQQQLQANSKYWIYGGDAPGENAPYTFWRDTLGFHIGVQAPSNATWAGIYGVTRSTNAMLYHAVVTAPVQTMPTNGVYYEAGMYVQTNGSQNVNYVTCTSSTSSFGTVWALFSATGNPFGATNFTRLWYDPSANQPLTRDCTIITNGSNYLKAYLDGKLVYNSTSLNLQMPSPFMVFLEPQSSYAGQLLNSTFIDYYAASGENATVTNLPTSAARVDITDSSGNVLATSQVSGQTASLDVGQYDFPLAATINVYDSSNNLIASNAEHIYGGDVYSIISK